MNIGVTYDLRDDYLAMGMSEEETAEFDRASTIDGLSAAIEACGHRVDRVGHVKALASRLVRGDRWDLVFNIAEGVRGMGREAQVPALLDAYNIPHTMSDALVCALTLHKGMTKHLVRDLGVPTPAFAVVESPRDVDRVDLGWPIFAKPVAEGTSKGVDARSRIASRDQLRQECERLLRTFRQPVLVEEYLPGREVTVGILGTGDRARVLGVMEVKLRASAEPGVYSYANKEKSEDLVDYALASDDAARDASDQALRVWRGLGCRDAGRVDLRQDTRGRMSFMEVNPLPGLHPEHSDLPIMASLAGLSYRELIRQILESASERVGGRR